MTDDLNKLAALLRDDVPPPSAKAKMAAINAGMQAFEENSEKLQGSPDPARLIHNRPKMGRGLLEGLKDMFTHLTGRQVMLGTASFATIALAVVITQDINFKSGPGPEIDFLGTNEIGLIEAPKSGRTDNSALSEADEGYVLAAPSTEELAQVAPLDSTSSVADMAPAPEPVDNAIAAAPVVRERVESDTRSDAPSTVIADGFSAQLSAVAPAAEALIGGIAESRNVASGLFNTEADTRIYDQETNRDQFAGESVSPLKITNDEPVSTFSIDVDTASYAFARNAILGGYLPNPDAVRTEEMINYFSYDYPLPTSGEAPFTSSVTVTETPWNPNTQLLHIGIQGYELAANERPPVNLVFLIDTSGSMGQPNKLPLLIQSFRLLLSELNDHDSVAIVTYAGSAGMALEPTPATERTKILNSLTRLSSGGSTAGQAGLQQAYALAAEMADDGDTSRVILATDGDFNVGISNTEELKSYIEDQRDTGIYLSVLGFGQGNYNDALMQTLAQNGNGTAAYIDTLAEAQKVLVDQIGGALFTIAQDVKIQVEFNPAEIAEYRLIGYETRALAREDFNNDAVDAGDIGAGHSVTALYEITPIGSAALSNDPLRYGTTEALPESNGELAFLKLRYKNPGESTSILLTTPVFANADAGLGAEVDFATAVASFGQLLRGDTRLGNWSYDDIVALANTAKGDDPFGYRAEFIRLVRLAETAQ